MARGIVFRREKPVLGADEDLFGVQATSLVSFVEDKNGCSYFLVARYYPLYRIFPQITFQKVMDLSLYVQYEGSGWFRFP